MRKGLGCWNRNLINIGRNKMKYKVFWSKTYYMNGTEEIEADTPEEAIKKMDKLIGDLEGSMQYYPDDNIIEVEE